MTLKKYKQDEYAEQIQLIAWVKQDGIRIDERMKWIMLCEGLEVGTSNMNTDTHEIDSTLHVIRVDPEYFELVLLSADLTEENRSMTAEKWCTTYDLVAAVNAGMFQADHRTHVGYMKSDGNINNSGINHYKSVAAFGSLDTTKPSFRIFDLDEINNS